MFSSVKPQVRSTTVDGDYYKKDTRTIKKNSSKIDVKLLTAHVIQGLGKTKSHII